MRMSRSCSPRSKCCPTTCSSDCCKPCSMPGRRCQSLSPRRRHKRRFYERMATCNPCDTDQCLSYDSSHLPRSGDYMARSCSPCRPRGSTFSDLCGSKACFSRKYYPCSPPYTSRRDACFPLTCEPCIPRRDRCVPKFCSTASQCYPRSCRPCGRRSLSSRVSYSPCFTLKCDPCYSLKCDPCYPLKCDPCYPLKCDPCYPLKCDPCYTSRRRRNADYCVPRPCSPVCSPVRDTYTSCRYSRRRYCSPRDNAPEVLTNIKLRDLRCDNFTKVCYPKELPLKACATKNCKTSPSTSQEQICEIAKVDNVRTDNSEGPSRNFLQKSRRLGTCMGRFEPHFCPWEADVSISGTVRGHCTSTAVEVARRMSGRFRAEGDRFTKDSCESIAPCALECQKMNLGRLDDGTSLNFTRNMSRNDNKSEETEPRPINLTKNSYRHKRNRRSENHSENYNSCYSAVCGETPDVTSDNQRSSRLLSSQQMCFDDCVQEQKARCSKRSSNHSVRFDSANGAASYKSVPETNAVSQSYQDASTSYTDIQNFLTNRKDRRRRIRAKSPLIDTSRNIVPKSPAGQLPDLRKCTSPSMFSSRDNHTPHSNSVDNSPLFTPPTHLSAVNDESGFTSSTSRDELVSPSKYRSSSRKIKESTEYHEISLDVEPNNRQKSYRQKCGDNNLPENRRR